MIRFDLPTPSQLQQFVRRQLITVSLPDEAIVRIVDNMPGATYADAERVCLDLRRACAVRGDRRVQSDDVAIALERYAIRQTVLTRAAPGPYPAVDKE